MCELFLFSWRVKGSLLCYPATNQRLDLNLRLAEVQKHSGKAAYKRTGAKWDVHNLKSYLLSTALTSGNWWKLTGSHTEVNKTVKCCRMSLFPVFLKARFFCLHELLSSCCLFFDVWRVWPSNFYSAPFVPQAPGNLQHSQPFAPNTGGNLQPNHNPFSSIEVGVDVVNRLFSDIEEIVIHSLFSVQKVPGFFIKNHRTVLEVQDMRYDIFLKGCQHNF